MVTIDCVSDMHGNYPKLAGGDVLIVAGDMTARDIQKEWNQFFEWLDRQQYRKKIFIGGNHDNMLEQLGNDVMLYAREIVGLREEMAEYLCDSGTAFEGLKIWGSPWSSQFPGINPRCCAFTRQFMARTDDIWDLIPNDVDILITHTPPYGILDRVATEFDASVGDMQLLEVLEKRIKPKLHVFGHIHEQGGKELIYKRPGYGTENNTRCVNSSIVDERYRHVNPVVRVILEEKEVSPEEENGSD